MKQIVPHILIDAWEKHAIPIKVNNIKKLVPGEIELLVRIENILKKNKIIDKNGIVINKTKRIMI